MSVYLSVSVCLSLDQGKHKQRKCERPLSMLSAKPETGLEAPKRYHLHDNHNIHSWGKRMSPLIKATEVQGRLRY